MHHLQTAIVALVYFLLFVPVALGKRATSGKKGVAPYWVDQRPNKPVDMTKPF